MSDDPRAAIIEKLRELSVAFPNREVPEETIILYANRLASLPAPAVCQAIDRLIDTSSYFPTIAEIKHEVIAAYIDPSFVETAWSEVMREVARVGLNRIGAFRDGDHQAPPKPTFSSPLIAEAVAAIGWHVICQSERPETVRSQFISALRAIVARETKRVQTGASAQQQLPFPTQKGRPQ